jgi:hypothetical protein
VSTLIPQIQAISWMPAEVGSSKNLNLKTRSIPSMKLSKLFLSASAMLFASNLAVAAGNGIPNGQKLLFNLEVIAYDKNNCPQGNLTGGGHRIAVRADVSDNPAGTLKTALVRENDIMLRAGEFAVIDGNACVDGVATFQLPANPIGGTLDDPTFQEYEVYARLVGKPGTGVGVTTCATDPVDPTITTDDIIVCSTENYTEVRQKGTAPKFTNVSKQLLTLCLDTTGDTVCDTRYALFDLPLYDYFWNWNTAGKAHAQLFFVALPD